ncbi:MAG: hypothetical protein ACYCUM_13605 [Solirubrobacteraceae bacterium]
MRGVALREAFHGWRSAATFAGSEFYTEEHMFKAIARHLNPATLLAFVALVFAMTGGAYAASGGVGASAGGHGVAVTSAAKKGKTKKKDKGKGKVGGNRGPRGPEGKQGPVGATGPAGPVGATGPAGPAGKEGAAGKEGPAGKEGKAGANGKDGTNGTNGAAGAPGASVEVVNKAPVNCPAGGYTYKVAGSASQEEVCNGAEGKAATALKAGETETGHWSVSIASTEYVIATKKFGYGGFAAITYPVPLENGAFTETKFLKPGEGGTEECPGNVQEPKAAAGYLCVYAFQAEPTISATGFHYLTSVNAESHGQVLAFVNPEKVEGYGLGSWAVTPE